MASQAQPQPGGAPAQGAPAPAQGGGQGANPLQIIAAISKLSQTLAQGASPCAPECEQVIQLMQSCAQKIMQANPNPGGSGQAPY